MRFPLLCLAFVAACGAAQSDRDFDGLPDVEDACPDDAEDLDGFEDEDGCYDGDDDQDGIPDAPDLCPRDAEDRDGFEDDDGCPDLDNDQDRILDIDDQCPFEPEVYNGTDDEDGCPDIGRVELHPHITPIRERVYFRSGSTEILEPSQPILDAVVATLQGNPQIEKVGLVGAATDDEPSDMALQRARAVRDALVAAGIDAASLETFAEGTHEPGEEAGRNVTFYVLRRAGRDVARWDGERIEDLPVE